MVIFRVFSRSKKEEVKKKVSREVKEVVVPPPKKIPKGFEPIERYPLYDPFAHAIITQNEETGEILYVVDELPLLPRERKIYDMIVDTLRWELKPPEDIMGDPREYFRKEAMKVIHKYRISLGKLAGVSWSKILYYVERNIVGYGKIDPLMRDPNIEDISCDGVGKPIYIWHRKYENIPTTIRFDRETELDEFIMKMAHMAGKHISSAFPILDCMLPGMHRLAATFRREVSTSGSTFTIRKYREEPFSIIDLLRFGTIDSKTAAYLWLAVEHKMTTFIIGVTGSGKSVSGKSRLLAIVKGKPGVYTIDEIWEIVKDKAIKENGYEVVYKPEVLIRSFNTDNMRSFWVKPYTIIKHRNDKRMYRIRLRSGRYVDVTEDHSLIVMDRHGRFVEAKPSSDIIGRWVVLPNISPTISIKRDNLTLKNILRCIEDPAQLYVKVDRDIREILDQAVKSYGRRGLTKLLGYSSESSLRTQKKIRLDKFLKLIRLYDKLPKTLMVASKVGKPVDISDVINKFEFAELLGLYIAEGNITEHGGVRITFSEPKYIVELCKRIPGTRYYVGRSKGRAPYIVITGTLASIIRSLDVGTRSRDKRLPRIFWIATPEWKARLLKGYIRGDGYFSKEKLEISTASEELAWDLLFAFGTLGITATISTKYNSNYNKFYYIVRVSSYFYDELRILGIIDEKYNYNNDKPYNWTVYDNIPAELLFTNKGTIHELRSMSKSGLGLLMLRFYKGKAISRKTLKRIIERSGIETPYLNSIIGLNIMFDKIVAIEEIIPEDVVYDFEVPGAESFEANNIIVHNTSTLNALATMFHPSTKVVTIEDTPELRLPLENWVQLVSRPSYGMGPEKIGEITLYDLVKVSLRYRPDIIIVGEVRGEEAYVLFQALASVSWDTPVMIREKTSGTIRVLPIGKFVDRYYGPREERVAKYIKGYEVLTLDANGNITWKPIIYVLRHTADEVYSLRYVGGGTLKATGSHSVFVLDENTMEIKEKPVSNIKPGEILVSFTANIKRKRNPTINLIKILGDNQRVYVDNLPNHLKRKLKHNPVPIAKYIISRGPLNLDTLRLKLRRSKYQLPATLELDEELAYLMGAYLADGCIKSERGLRICFTLGNSEEAIARRIIKIMEKKFKVKPTVDRRGSYTIYEYNHTLLAEAFKKLMGSRLEEKHIPQQLWEAPIRVVRAFLEGYRADSRRTLRRNYIAYTTKSYRLAVEILWLTRIHGFYSFLCREKSKNGSNYYTVAVYLKEGRRPTSRDKFPLKPFRILIEKLKPKNMPLRYTYINKSNRRFVSRKIAKDLLDWILNNRTIEPNNNLKKLISRINILLNSDITLAVVKKVNRECYKGYVYDISVPESEAFLGGEVPVLLHNTGHGGLSTIHAESVEAAIKRLLSPPMNIPEGYIPLINIALIIKRVRIRPKNEMFERAVRRITGVFEVRDYKKYVPISSWNPFKDEFNVNLEDSKVLNVVSETTGKTVDELLEEVERRKLVLDWMLMKNIRNYKEAAEIFRKYYANPEKIYKRVKEEVLTTGETS